MNKRRKYDGKNKRSFIIILILAIFIVAIFSLFIYKYSKVSKIEYSIESGTVIQDVDKNFINIDEDALLKIRWNGDYYLEYNDEKINLSNKVIAFNSLTGGMKLYGNFYEIASDGKIIENKNETVLANTTDCKFFKLDDREYLLVDRKIFSEDYSIEANNYLLVELDKAGNAKLSNDKVNLKTISPTILKTTKYKFDIANEILNFGEYDIDLKKIIGSTNQYVPEEENVKDDDGKDDDNQIGTGIGTGQVGGPGNIVNNTDDGDVSDMEEVLDKIKMTSVIRVVEGLTQIDIDYVIYDPYNEYKSVFVEISSAGNIDIVHLSKTDTHLVINNLKANTDYKLRFVYTSVTTDKDTGVTETVTKTFEEFDLRTKMPEYSIAINKISTVYNTVNYKVTLDKGFNISKVNVNLSFDYKEIDDETGEMVTKKASVDSSVDVTSISGGYIYGNFNISGYPITADTLLKLTVKSVVADSIELPINSYSTFRFGR